MTNHREAVFWLLLAALHPWAATGAAFGCCFFLASPASTRGWQRVKLGLFSWGIGYAAGVFTYGGGPPYSDKAMLVSAGVSALAAIIFTGLYHVIATGGPLPPWLESMLDRVPFLKRKGGGDGV
jgi:hypothetical protein